MRVGISLLGKNKIVIAVYDEELNRIRVIRVSTTSELKEALKAVKPSKIIVDKSAEELKELLGYFGEVEDAKEIDKEEIKKRLQNIEALSIINDNDLNAVGAVIQSL